MAGKPKRRRRMGKYIRGAVDESLGAAALAALDVVLAAFDQSVNERMLISSLVATYTMQGLTAATEVGPLMVGIAHSDYTAAEIEEWIETTDSWDEGNKQQQEVAGRLIRKIGIFRTMATATESTRLNDGRPIRTKLNWILLQGQSLSLWVYNLGSQPVATTTPEIDVQGHANLWPR